MFSEKITTNEKGMTLAEVLIAMLVTGIAVAGILSAFTLGSFMSRSVSSRTSATYLCQQLAEEILREQYDQITNAAYASLPNVNVGDGIVMTRSVTVGAEYFYADTNTRCKNVTITVSWSERGILKQENIRLIVGAK